MGLVLNFSLILSLSFSLSLCLKHRDILFNEFSTKTNSLSDINVNVWRNKLKNDFNENIQKLPENVKKSIIETADKELKNKWEPLLVMDYLEYKMENSGYSFYDFTLYNRFYEIKVNNRNKRLMDFVLAELLTESGKYMNEVANGLWLILEESTWVWPAHLSIQKAGIGLPDPSQLTIDLGAGERSALVSWLGFLLGDKLEKMSPMLVKRINYELNRRIYDTFLHNEFSWMGLEGQRGNNWNVWINSNILISALLNLHESERLNVINRTVKSADDWLNWYGDDGGCDEGPGYWGVAGGRFIQFMNHLSEASNHQINWSTNQLINNIGSYIYKLHIDGEYFVNFADAEAKIIPQPDVVFSYGQTLNNTLMKGFGAYLFRLRGNDSYLINEANSGALHQFYKEMLAYPSLENTAPKAPQPMDSWLPSIEVLTLRSQEGSPKGLFLGAKAGNNGENHNHNDVGNFVLYVDGKPAIIDVGVGTYTSSYFGKKRYTIWNLQSQWHNTPTINGVQQHDGLSYKAKDVKYEKNPNTSIFEVNISGAYPTTAHVNSFVRKLTFNRTSNSIDLSENYKLNKFVEPLKIHFITVLNTTVEQNRGQILLQDMNVKLVMKFEANLFDVKIDKPSATDPRITKNWGENIKRVTLVSKQNLLEGKHSISFHL